MIVKIEDFLRRICASLELNNIPYMVTGSVASSIHGIPRSTNDLDIVIAPTREQLRALVQVFKRFGYYARWEEKSHFNGGISSTSSTFQMRGKLI